MIGPPRRRRRLRSTRTKHVYDRLGRNTSAIDSDETRLRSTRTEHVYDRLGRNTSAIDSDGTRLRSTRTEHVRDRLGRNTFAIDSDETRPRSTRTEHVRSLFHRRSFTCNNTHAFSRRETRAPPRRRRPRGIRPLLNLERLSSRPRRLIPSELSPHATERESISDWHRAVCHSLVRRHLRVELPNRDRLLIRHVGICHLPVPQHVIDGDEPPGSNQSQ